MSATRPSCFLYPPACTLTCYSVAGVPLLSSRDRKLDLADSLVFLPDSILFGVSSKSVRWKRWDEENLGKVEWLIRYDITFDGFKLWMRRRSKVGQPCTEEFLWRMTTK